MTNAGASGPSTESRPWVIRTDIPSIDDMFRISGGLKEVRGGIGLADLASSTSIAIVGPQGTGKSVLAMHVAARYLADSHAAFAHVRGAMPRVCYVSTDMTHPVAGPALKRFGLDRPNQRRIPFGATPAAPGCGRATPEWLRCHRPEATTFDPGLTIQLKECPADEPEKLGAFLLEESAGAGAEIAFVDLASRTSGDDWAFVHRLLGVLSDPDDSAPRHLVVIDAIEGLETFGGELDAFGEASLRRARVAKLIRQAVGKCHLVLIVEEAEGRVLPEEFVSDVVFRLQSADEHGYLRRTLQIEKARGQATVRGLHSYVIRSGFGSTTGKARNYDDPQVVSAANSQELQSYVELFPSLHYATRAQMLHEIPSAAETGTRDERRPERAGFGIEYLDELLPAKGPGAHRDSDDDRGLPCSTITGLIGDAGTQKTGLGVAFLGQAFEPVVRRLIDGIEKGDVPKHTDPESCRSILRERFARYAGVPVLITTHNESRDDLATYFVRRLARRRRHQREDLDDGWKTALRELMIERTVCRRLEIHDMPASVLFSIVKRTTEAGLRIAAGGLPDPLEPWPPGTEPEGGGAASREVWRVRVVIDDLSTIMDTYAMVQNDPLFLPFLLYYLRREELTTLLIDTRAGRPWEVAEEGFQTGLRALSDNRVYTWPVTGFFGDHRVAIAAIPPIVRDHRARVREVKRLPPDTGTGKGELFVDPVFELYAGLEENRPQIVPLEVRLYGETPACREYGIYLNEIFERIFRAYSPRAEQPGCVVVTEREQDYAVMRDASYLKADMWLDHTLIVQLDEFWRQSSAGGHHERKYLLDDMSRAQSDAELDVRDPFQTYREWNLIGRSENCVKGSFFDIPGCDVSDPRMHQVDRVPYLWDFGFLACRADAWTRAAQLDDDAERVWNACTLDASAAPPEGPADLSWATFLEAACKVATRESGISRQHVPALDLAAPSRESFSCLVLEVWLSEILLTLRRHNPPEADRLREQLGRRRWKKRSRDERTGAAAAREPEADDRRGMQDLLRPGARQKATGQPEGALPGWSLELYKTWLLLVEALDLERLALDESRSGYAAAGDPRATAVAVRHWYKTACAVPEDARRTMGRIRYVRLPGSFTTRGDWFLGVAPESRSYLLASRALDLLCSARGSRNRLERGVGLPTRRLAPVGQGLDGYSSFRTPLREETAGPALKTLTYADIRRLGSRIDSGSPDGGGERLGWLWRSGLKNYHRHELPWLSWLVRMSGEWAQVKSAKLRDPDKPWQEGFGIYRKLDEAPEGVIPREVEELDTFALFSRAVPALIAELSLVDATSAG